MTGRIVVVGAGVTGLAAAHRLRSASPERDVLVLEREERPGGKVGAVTVGGLELEAGPDSFLARKPWAVDLCGDLGLGDDLVPAAVGSTQLWTEHGLVPFPPGPLGIPTSVGELWRADALPSSAKLRASLDLVLPRRRGTADESLRSLLRRRLGRRAAAELVEPLLGGVLAADPGQVSAAATFPELVAWEHERRSLIRGAHAMAAGRRPVAVGDSAAEAGGGAPATFLTVRGGLRRMIDALVTALGPDVLRTGTPVGDIRGGEASRFVLRADGSDIDADAVIVTTPAAMSAGLLTAIAPEAAAGLRTLGSTSTAVAVLVYPDGTDARLPASSGFVATPGSLPITAATLVSRKWPDPAFGSRAVVRAFVADGALLRADDEELIGTVGAALADVYPLPAMPFASAVVRWPEAMPRYDVGHLERVASIEAALPPGVVVAGSAFHGVGVPDCIRQGTEAAERVTAILARA